MLLFLPGFALWASLPRSSERGRWFLLVPTRIEREESQADLTVMALNTAVRLGRYVAFPQPGETATDGLCLDVAQVTAK